MGVSKTGKTPASDYKRDVSVSQTTNTGFDSTTRKLCSGDGADSAASLSDDVLSVQPVNDDTTGTMLVKNNAGNNILAVDTVNSKVLAGASQVAVNTQYAYFGVTSAMGLSTVAGTHYAVSFNNVYLQTAITMGTGTEPSTSYDISANNSGNDMASVLWYIPDNITVDQVYWMAGGHAAAGDTINIHLLSFDFDAGVGAGKGDLSNGIVVAGGADKVSLGYENVIYESIAPASADVDAGKVCMVTFESNGTNSDYSINATVKYHIR